MQRTALLFAAALVAVALFAVLSMQAPADMPIPTVASSDVVPREVHLQRQLGAKVERRANGYAKPEAPEKVFEYLQQIRQWTDSRDWQYGHDYRERALREAPSSAHLRMAGQVVEFVDRGPGNVSGRTRALVVDPDDPTGDTWFAGAVGGGVWKTTDAGQSWEDISPEMTALSVTSIAMTPSNPDVLYVGTGEGFGNTDAVDGDGIWKSVDRGESWQQLASTAATPEFDAVNRIAVHREDQDVVLAATNTGLYRSADAGTTWEAVFEIQSRVQQVVAAPDSADHFYATVNGRGVLRSTDAGQTWTRTDLTGSRFELAVAQTNPDVLYVSAEANGSTLYRSDDRGETFVEILPQGEAINWLGSQGWYDNTIAAPTTGTSVFVGGIDLWGLRIRGNAEEGYTYRGSAISDWRAHPNSLHADHHGIVFGHTEDGGTRLISLSDGGVAYSDTNTAPWTMTLSGGYNTSQPYGADKMPGGDAYLTGLQDNGTWFSPQNVEATGETDWIEINGGDGFEVVWHDTDPDKMLFGSQYGDLRRTLDGGQTVEDATAGYTDTGNSFFLNTLESVPALPDVVFTTSPTGIWRTLDFGGMWEQASFTDGGARYAAPLNRAPVAASAADPAIVWSGMGMDDDRSLYVSTDTGATFAPTENYRRLSALVTGLATHPTLPETAFATFSASAATKILRTDDLGQSWRPITGGYTGPYDPVSSNGFPNVVTYDMLVIPQDTTLFWAATDVGLFVSTDEGQTWAREERFPAVSIWQLQVADDQVVIATHGRGVWTADLATVVSDEEAEEPKAFEVAASYPNPFDEATRVPVVLGAAGPLKAQVFDLQGRHVATLHDGPMARGEHELTWRPDASLASGAYVVRVEAGGRQQSRTLTLVR